MRKVFQTTVSEALLNHNNLVLLLGDIGVFGFRDVMSKLPKRALNMGIMEQAMISFAAGIAKSGAIPVVHSIAPFLIERPFEQLKVDFGYQKLVGKFVSVGGSFDYSALGGTHHCPGDVSLIGAIPGFQVFLPNSGKSLKAQLERNLLTPQNSYFRLSEEENVRSPNKSHDFGISVFAERRETVVVFIGSSIIQGLEACEGLDVGVMSLEALDSGTASALASILDSGQTSRLIFVEPYYEGSTYHFVSSLQDQFQIRFIGVPREFCHAYGSRGELLEDNLMDSKSLRQRISTLV